LVKTVLEFEKRPLASRPSPTKFYSSVVNGAAKEEYGRSSGSTKFSPSSCEIRVYKVRDIAGKGSCDLIKGVWYKSIDMDFTAASALLLSFFLACYIYDKGAFPC
jgi:hypothetical protein